MSSEREMTIYLAYMESSHKFDHFLLGASLAACGYLAQTNPYGRIGFNIETMYLVALLTLSASVLCAFRRLEQVTSVLRANSDYLEMADRLTPDQRQRAYAALQVVADRPKKWYLLRNGFLYGGFIAYITTKVFAAYLQP
ncbi:TPA: hypothetical protein OTR99_001792 [Pseudomonas aeruginosa]|uniref:hypothetical protein n=1 Tax=Pseudomonas aeruginosa TaxID=287 RepID=UPI000F84A29E|nr:hypothetical protein [Pseudomonas aeruginosa]MDG4031297.1 hypothetical protein [Pseudomonas aeruginosa]RTV75122.1 hypothetical protein DY997_24020 [Pseudomonas aeruginosa]HCT2655596.1 hypothetical protein [Pseudomonas aeruginosa]